MMLLKLLIYEFTTTVDKEAAQVNIPEDSTDTIEEDIDGENENAVKT